MKFKPLRQYFNEGLLLNRSEKLDESSATRKLAPTRFEEVGL